MKQRNKKKMMNLQHKQLNLISFCNVQNINSDTKNDYFQNLLLLSFYIHTFCALIIIYFFSPLVDSGGGLTILSWPPSLLAAVAAFTSLQ